MIMSVELSAHVIGSALQILGLKGRETLVAQCIIRMRSDKACCLPNSCIWTPVTEGKQRIKH